ncbi:hypothetical protein WCD74_03290 [Actinomycetospora sp. OC33-EN08]|uniref:Uncharacterized protein n=1 Tax=Actinomycetospora aurantiaca TaxID=3129233 RepID=A0ABU8MI19_9PSEU
MAIEKQGPLLIGAITTDWPQFGFGGTNWGFQTTSSWRLVGDEGIVTSSGSPDLESGVLGLVHLSVVAVSEQARLTPGDPVFLLDNGWRLEVFSELALDPWSMMLPDIVFVGEPGR